MAEPKEQSQSFLVTHRNTVFEDDTIQVVGHAYVNCTFKRCTIVVREGPSYMSDITFGDCIFKFDVVAHNYGAIETIERFAKLARTSFETFQSRARDPDDPAWAESDRAQQDETD